MLSINNDITINTNPATNKWQAVDRKGNIIETTDEKQPCALCKKHRGCDYDSERGRCGPLS